MQQEPEAVAAVADQSWWPFGEEESTPLQQRQQKRSKSQHGQSGQEGAEDVGAGLNVCGSGGDHMHKAQTWLSAGGEGLQKLGARGPQSPLVSPFLGPLDASHTGSVERSADSCEQPRRMCQEQATVRHWPLAEGVGRGDWVSTCHALLCTCPSSSKLSQLRYAVCTSRCCSWRTATGVEAATMVHSLVAGMMGNGSTARGRRDKS